MFMCIPFINNPKLLEFAFERLSDRKKLDLGYADSPISFGQITLRDDYQGHEI